MPKPPARSPWLWRLALALGAGCALGGTFLLYRNPDFLLQLSNQIWGCL